MPFQNSFLVSSCQGCVANLIERAELKGDAVDTFGEGVAEVDAAHRLGESAHLAKVLRNIKMKMLNKQTSVESNTLAKLREVSHVKMSQSYGHFPYMYIINLAPHCWYSAPIEICT